MESAEGMEDGGFRGTYAETEDATYKEFISQVREAPALNQMMQLEIELK